MKNTSQNEKRLRQIAANDNYSSEPSVMLVAGTGFISGFLPSTRRAGLQLHKIVPDDFVNLRPSPDNKHESDALSCRAHNPKTKKPDFKSLAL